MGGTLVEWPNATDGSIVAFSGWLYRLDLANAQGIFAGAE
jgi:hypothetical protein